MCDGVTEWENELFYANRFSSDVPEPFDIADVNENGNLLDN